MKPRSYREAGVDLEKEQASIAALVSQLSYQRHGLGRPIGPEGFFTAVLDMGDYGLTLNVDGVGTKLLVARDVERWQPVGIDCVAMNVNDTVCVGAEPLAMVDYFAIERYDEEVAKQVGEGLNMGAEMANISIVGGELATLPEIVRGYDLVGACLGYVRKDRVVDGSGVKPGHVLIGLESSGPHSNGYTLIRRLLQSEGVSYAERVPGSGETFGEALLKPTEIYVKDVLAVLESCSVTGMAHITGGGLSNLARIRQDVAFEVDSPFRPQPIFEALRDIGGLDITEMYRTFNMGQGFVLVTPEDQADVALEVLRRGHKAKIIGRVTRGSGVHLPDVGRIG